jgi:tRNA (guanosine-2'-O-)-methyltransferase
VFGNEFEGVSEALLAGADAWCRIPMDGFVQSFNISVAAAVCLYHVRADRMARAGRHGDLDPVEQEALRASFYIRSVRAAAQILERAEAAP